MTAVNIDSGYAAAMAAYRILSGGPRRWDRKEKAPRTPPTSTSTPRRSASTASGRRRSSAAPTTPIKLGKTTTVSQLLDSYRDASFQARALGKAAGVFEAMLRDRKRPTIFLGLAGSLIAAGMRQVIVDLIEQKMVDVIVSTGAIISQDYYQVRGGRHYHGTPDADDKELRDLYIDRLYDTFIDEEKYWETDLAVSRFADALGGKSLSSRGFLALLAAGRKHDKGSILGACARHGVPLFVPGPERLLDRHRPDRALPPLPQGREEALRDQLDPRQLRAHADRRPEPGDGRGLRLGRRAEELHQRLDRDVLHLRPRHGRPQVRAPGHDRRAALGRPRRLDALGSDLVGQGLQEGDARDGLRRDVRGAAAASTATRCRRTPRAAASA